MAKTTKAPVEDKPTLTEGEVPPVMSTIGGAALHCVIGRTINTGNFESFRVEYGETRPLPDPSKRKDVGKALYADVKSVVEYVEKVVRQQFGVPDVRQTAPQTTTQQQQAGEPGAPPT